MNINISPEARSFLRKLEPYRSAVVPGPPSAVHLELQKLGLLMIEDAPPAIYKNRDLSKGLICIAISTYALGLMAEGIL